MSKLKQTFAGFAAFASLAFTNAAFAALDSADVTALGTEVDGDIDVVKGAVLPIIFTVVALVVGIKVLKRLTSKI